jgi:hypothetical protein
MSADQFTAAPSRRDFIKTTTAATLGLSFAPMMPGAYASGTDAIRIGLIGCGGRGTGAVLNAFDGAEGVKLVAMGDAFADRLASSLAEIGKEHAAQIEVPKDRQFVGFDAYKKVLGERRQLHHPGRRPPGFRPIHLAAGVAAGKHIFTEKPVGRRRPGIRQVLDVYEQAKAKGSASPPARSAAPDRLPRDDEAGSTTARSATIAGGALLLEPGLPLEEGSASPDWSDAEWQLRNWLYFTVAVRRSHRRAARATTSTSSTGRCGRTRSARTAWAAARCAPVRTSGTSSITSRSTTSTRTARRCTSQCRQIEAATSSVSEALIGDRAEPGGQVRDHRREGVEVRRQGQRALRAGAHRLHRQPARGQAAQRLKNVAESTLTAIMGRMSAYTGQP